MPTIAATVFLIMLGLVIAFQFALALGAPWGALAMGGRFPGKFPSSMRAAAVVQSLLLMLFGYIVLVRDGFLSPGLFSFSTFAIWGVVVIFSISFLMNLATPSKWERNIWAPVAATMLGCSIIVALS